MTILEEMLESKVVSIVRRVYGEDLKNLAGALCAGGVKFIECTFDQVDPDHLKKTAEAISMLKETYGDKMHVGAGTVLTPAQVNAAYEAGGEFIISPNVSPAVIGRTRKLGLISIPGAMTPTEILTAHDLGADVVKLFPANTLGLKYIKDIMAPITHVKLLATGGVTVDNFADFLAAGMVGAGVGGYLSDKKLIAEGNWAELTQRAEAFSAIARGKN